MAALNLKCRNCGTKYTWDTPYPTYVGRTGEIELNGPGGIPRIMFPVCPKCTSGAVEVQP